jgi:starch synthase
MWEQKGLDLTIEPLRARLRAAEIQLVVLGSGDPAVEAAFLSLAAEFPQRAFVKTGYDNQLAHRIEAASDFFLMPSRFEPCGLNQLYSMTYGTLPIVRNTGGLADTVDGWHQGDAKSTGIVFEHADSTGVQWALGQAIKLYYQHENEFHAVRHRAMSRTFSWNTSAVNYVRCYEEAIRQRRHAFSAPAIKPAAIHKPKVALPKTKVAPVKSLKKKSS